jgi:phosphate uptake regulator
MVGDAVEALVAADTALADSVTGRWPDLQALDREIACRVVQTAVSGSVVSEQDRGEANGVTAAQGALVQVGAAAVELVRLERRMTALGVRYTPLVDLARFGELATEMVRRATDAHAAGDAVGAQVVRALAEDARCWSRDGQTRLQAAMENQREDVLSASHLLMATRQLDRICEHASAMAERRLFEPEERVAPDTTPAKKLAFHC